MFNYYAMSRMGPNRTFNEDDVDVFIHEQVLFMIVADGQGSDASGQSAGKIAIDEMKRYLLQEFHAGYESHLEFYFKQSFYIAQRAIEGVRKGNEDRYSGFCAAVTMVAVTMSKEMIFAHVGNTQCMMWRNGELYVVTEPHTVAYDQYKQQKISQAELINHPERRILTQALGVVSNPTYVIQRGILQKDDMLLLVTDGIGDLGLSLIREGIFATDNTQSTAEWLIRTSTERIPYDDGSIAITFLNF